MVTFNIGCKKENINLVVLKSLYDTYKEGEITECIYDGELVYSASLNVYGGSTGIYNYKGIKIAGCNYSWGTVDPICKQLEKCSVIYRCKNHISGQEFIDKYELSI